MNPHRAALHGTPPLKLRYPAEGIFLPSLGEREAERTLKVRAIYEASPSPSPFEAQLFADFTGAIVGGMLPHGIFVALEKREVVSHAKVVPRVAWAGVGNFRAALRPSLREKRSLLRKRPRAACDFENQTFGRESSQMLARDLGSDRLKRGDVSLTSRVGLPRACPCFAARGLRRRVCGSRRG